MKSKVEGFPFNVTGSPMYWGSTCSFLGWAFVRGRFAGLVLTAEVFMMYILALQYEEYARAGNKIDRPMLTYPQSVH